MPLGNGGVAGVGFDDLGGEHGGGCGGGGFSAGDGVAGDRGGGGNGDGRSDGVGAARPGCGGCRDGLDGRRGGIRPGSRPEDGGGELAVVDNLDTGLVENPVGVFVGIWWRLEMVQGTNLALHDWWVDGRSPRGGGSSIGGGGRSKSGGHNGFSELAGFLQDIYCTYWSSQDR